MSDRRRPDMPTPHMYAHLLDVCKIDPRTLPEPQCALCGADVIASKSRPIVSPRIRGAREYLCDKCRAEVLARFDELAFRPAVAAADTEPPCSGAGGHVWRDEVDGAPCARIACNVRRGDRA